MKLTSLRWISNHKRFALSVYSTSQNPHGTMVGRKFFSYLKLGVTKDLTKIIDQGAIRHPRAVQRFLGMLSFFAIFCPKLSDVVKPFKTINPKMSLSSERTHMTKLLMSLRNSLLMPLFCIISIRSCP